MGLTRQDIVRDNDTLYLFPWRGTSTLDALRLALRCFKLPVTAASFCLMVPAREEPQLRHALKSLAEPDEHALNGAQLAQLDEKISNVRSMTV